MNGDEHDPYDKGREAMQKALEVLHTEVIHSVKITKKGDEYHKVRALLSEYPIQHIEVFPRTVYLDGKTVASTDLDDGESTYIDKARLTGVEMPPADEGNELVLHLDTVEKLTE